MPPAPATSSGFPKRFMGTRSRMPFANSSIASWGRPVRAQRTGFPHFHCRDDYCYPRKKGTFLTSYDTISPTFDSLA
jgi:hypothetical protein